MFHLWSTLPCTPEHCIFYLIFSYWLNLSGRFNCETLRHLSPLILTRRVKEHTKQWLWNISFNSFHHYRVPWCSLGFWVKLIWDINHNHLNTRTKEICLLFLPKVRLPYQRWSLWSAASKQRRSTKCWDFSAKVSHANRCTGALDEDVVVIESTPAPAPPVPASEEINVTSTDSEVEIVTVGEGFRWAARGFSDSVCDSSAPDWAQRDAVSSLPNAHNLYLRFYIMPSWFVSLFSQPASRAQVLNWAQTVERFLVPATNSYLLLLFCSIVCRFSHFMCDTLCFF